MGVWVPMLLRKPPAVSHWGAVLFVGVVFMSGCDRKSDRIVSDEPAPFVGRAGSEATAPDPAQVAPPAVDPTADPIPVDNGAGKADDLRAEAVEDEPLSPNVKLKLEVNPKNAKAWVFWGRTRLGQPPLNFEHPRNSGPMDIVIKAEGFPDYHTRLFTDRNDKLVVNLVAPKETSSLLGYKHLTPPASALEKDAGVAPVKNEGTSPEARKPASDAAPAFVVPKGVQF